MWAWLRAGGGRERGREGEKEGEREGGRKGGRKGREGQGMGEGGRGREDGGGREEGERQLSYTHETGSSTGRAVTATFHGSGFNTTRSGKRLARRRNFPTRNTNTGTRSTATRINRRANSQIKPPKENWCLPLQRLAYGNLSLSFADARSTNSQDKVAQGCPPLVQRARVDLGSWVECSN